MRLSAGHRQSDGPDARDLRACRQHRPRRHPRHAVRRHAHRPHRDGDALDDRHRAAAVLGQAAWASRASSTAGRSSISRRRRSWSATSAWRRRRPGAPQGDRSQGVNGAFLAAITPETETSCHYFWNFVRTFKTDDEQLTARSATRPCQRRQGRLRPGSRRAGGAAARHRQEPAQALLQSQHRRRRALGAAHDRSDARARAGSERAAARPRNRRPHARVDRVARRRRARDARPHARYPHCSRSRRRASSSSRRPGSHINVSVHDRRAAGRALLLHRRPLHRRPLPHRGQAA